MAHDGRLGLATYPTEDGIIPSYRDAAQWVKAGVATRTVVAHITGGPGVYAGGATEFADLENSGTEYPASSGAPFRAAVADDSGYIWWFEFVANLTMTFNATSGACTAYLVVDLLSGVTPDAAVGGKTDATILVQLTADPAPANSLALFSGAVTDSAFTNFTEDGSARVGGGLYALATRTLTAGTGLTGGGDLSANRTLSIAAGGVGTTQLAADAVDGTKLADDAVDSEHIAAGAIDTEHIAASQVTYAKIQDVSATDKLLGRATAGAGVVEEIPLTAAGRALLDDASAAAMLTTLGIPLTGATDYSGSTTLTGWSSTSTLSVAYARLGPIVILMYRINGTSDATTASFTIPAAIAPYATVDGIIAYVLDNGAVGTVPGHLVINASATTVNLYRDAPHTAWTASGAKVTFGSVVYIGG